MRGLKAFCISLLKDLRSGGGLGNPGDVGEQGKPAHGEVLLGKAQVHLPDQLFSWDINKKKKKNSLCSYPSLEIKTLEIKPLKRAKWMSYTLEQSTWVSSCILVLQRLSSFPIPRSTSRKERIFLPRKHFPSQRADLLFFSYRCWAALCFLPRWNVNRQVYPGLAPCCLCR